MRKMVIWLAVAPILAVAWGCKGEQAWKGSVETVDGVQVVRNPKTPMYPQGGFGAPGGTDDRGGRGC